MLLCIHEITRYTKDILSIIKYYRDNFDIELKFVSLVYHPQHLSIRNSNNKETLIKNFDIDGPIVTELKREHQDKNIMKKYIHELDAYRKTDSSKLWPNLEAL